MVAIAMIALTRARVRTFRARRRELGAAYAAIAPVRTFVTRLSTHLENRLLVIEGARGILGAAHRGYQDHSIAENKEFWRRWDWSSGGEEWSESPEWKASLVEDVLLSTIQRTGVILEIGPGAGRWTEFLLARADRLILVDVSERTLEVCQQRFRDAGDITYLLTDDADLPGIPDASVDAVWSFDAFVHIAPIDLASYLREIARVLRPGGVAVIHHSGRSQRGQTGWRSPMTAKLFANLARERGLAIDRQFDSWRGGRFGVRANGDAITVLSSNAGERPRLPTG